MSLKPEPMPPIPKATKRIAKRSFPKGNIYMRMRDELGTFYQDEQFISLFSDCGQPGYSPWRLALISVMQFMEGLSDRQAAEAVRARIDWKYALSLKMDDSGFDYSVLSEFRTRLLDGGTEQNLLDTMLNTFQEHDLLEKRGKQRTDSTHVAAAIRTLNRLENLGETLRAALNSIASAAPDWLIQVAEPEWYDRYGKRIEESRLPKGKDKRREYAEIIGVDGMILLEEIYSNTTPEMLRQLPALETLRQTWVHQYYMKEGQLCLREAKDLPPASLRSDSPYDPEAHYATKRDVHWTGYKVHVTESCDADVPHLITHVETTPGPKADVDMTEPIHEALADKEKLPGEHFVDNGYVDAELLLSSQSDHQVELVGPVRHNKHWQAKAGKGYSQDNFDIDWEAKSVTCPQGHTTHDWVITHDPKGNPGIRVRFARSVCAACEVRSLCTRAVRDGRCLGLRENQAQYEALREARQKQETPEWKKRYTQRAGIEGTISQGTRAFELRQARYIGLTKTHLQHILTAAAINIVRVDNWLTQTPLAKTRTSRFKAIKPRAA
jgi:transposase